MCHHRSKGDLRVCLEIRVVTPHISLTSLHSVSWALGSAISMRSSPMRGTQVSVVWLWWWFPTMEFMLELEWFLGKKPSFSSFGWLGDGVAQPHYPAPDNLPALSHHPPHHGSDPAI